MADKDKEKDKEKGPEKGGSLKWIVIAVVVLLVLAGGGYVGFTTFVGDQKEDSEGKEQGVQMAELGPTYPLSTFIVNLAGGSGERYLKVTMELELKDNKVTSEVDKRKPQVRDTILLLLSSKTFDDIATFRGKTKLRNEIVARLNGILPPPSVKKVYFTEFVVQ